MFKTRASGLSIKKAPIKTDITFKGLPSCLPQAQSFLIINGPPRSGKSNFVFNLLKWYKPYFDVIYLFCPSKTLQYGVEEENWYPHYDEEEMKRIMNDPELDGLNILLLFDDVVNEVSKYSMGFKELADNRRHKHVIDEVEIEVEQEDEYGMIETIKKKVKLPEPMGSVTIWFVTQKLNKVHPDVRQACDSLACFNVVNREWDIVFREYVQDLIPWEKRMDFKNFVYDKPHAFLMWIKDKPANKSLFKSLDTIIVDENAQDANEEEMTTQDVMLLLTKMNKYLRMLAK